MWRGTRRCENKREVATRETPIPPSSTTVTAPITDRHSSPPPAPARELCYPAIKVKVCVNDIGFQASWFEATTMGHTTMGGRVVATAKPATPQEEGWHHHHHGLVEEGNSSSLRSLD
ncbi:hypothetical protein E2562_009012 [Oryza meyeriana var. granulata]|uniref:Uncharacterized protein n=1 Tax=Oryza meyeriana var. granulata TaxID=110450 RepID=A0A6G1D0S5_9ORYZ|nr:hypothetical protein E2562_009012 [Oryza meyeriana var. granulata]